MPQTYTLTEEQLGDDLTYLHLCPADAPEGTPAVLVLHGLGSGKESVLATLYAYAQAGFRAVAPDLRLHGERRGADEREERLLTAYALTMFEIVQGTVQDIALLLDHLSLAQAGLHGISLGGIVAFAALVAEPRLAEASVAMGNPDWAGMMQQMGLMPGHPAYDMASALSPLELAAQTYPPRPLLMLHGDLDEIVPADGVVALYERLLPFYQETPERLELILYPGLGHVYKREMVERSVAWAARFLPGNSPRAASVDTDDGPSGVHL